MNDAATLSPLLGLVGFQLALYALGWAVVAALLPEDREAVAHWGLFLLFASIGMLLATGRDDSRSWWAYNGTNVATVIGFAAMRRGTERFMGLRGSDRESLAVLVVAGGGIALLGPAPENSALRIVLAYGAQGVLMMRMMWAVREPVRKEFGSAAYRAIVWPGLLIATLLVLLALRQVVSMGTAQEMQRNTLANVGVIHVYLFGCALFNFGFTVLVTQRLVTQLRLTSRSDALTGLLNRGAIESELHRLWSGPRRERMALMLIDVDHFKRINDTHGHAAGDRVLAQVAAALATAAGGAARVGRWGGEEFVCVMSEADLESATRLAEALRAAVSAQGLPLRGQPLGVTLSIGVAAAHRDEPELDRLLARADAALYRAKQGGRDRVVAAEAPGPEPVLSAA